MHGCHAAWHATQIEPVLLTTPSSQTWTGAMTTNTCFPARMMALSACGWWRLGRLCGCSATLLVCCSCSVHASFCMPQHFLGLHHCVGRVAEHWCTLLALLLLGAVSAAVTLCFERAVRLLLLLYRRSAELPLPPGQPVHPLCGYRLWRGARAQLQHRCVLPGLLAPSWHRLLAAAPALCAIATGPAPAGDHYVQIIPDLLLYSYTLVN